MIGEGYSGPWTTTHNQNQQKSGRSLEGKRPLSALIRGVQAAAWNVGQKGQMDTIINPSILPSIQT